MKTRLLLRAILCVSVAGLVYLPSAFAAETAAPAAVPAGTPAATSEADEVMPVIDLQDTSIDAAIKGLADMANMNVDLDPKITAPGADGRAPQLPKVSIKWKNLTAKQALNALLDNYGYVAVTDPKTHVTRVTIKDANAQEPMTAHVVEMKYSSATNLIAVIKSAMTNPRSQLLSDPRTGNLIVLATETDFAQVTNLISRLDIPARQILIEARFFETSKSPKSVKGIDWTKSLSAQNISFGNGLSQGVPLGGSVSPVGGGTVTTTPGNTTTTTGTQPGGGTGGTSVSTAANSVNSILYTAIGQGIGGMSWNSAGGFSPHTAFLNADGLNVVLSFLNTDSDVQQLAAPRAVGQENQKTELRVVQNIPILKQEQGNISGGVTLPATVTPIYDTRVGETLISEVGVKLVVTPRVVGDTNVFLDLRPEISGVENQPVTQILNGQTSQGLAFFRRSITTVAVVPSGFTLVLGGLYQNDQTKQYTKVPLLGDIPGMGLLFRKDSKSASKQNLLIFVTPTIIADSDFVPNKTNAEFLKSKYPEVPDIDPPAWDAGKPRQKGDPMF